MAVPQDEIAKVISQPPAYTKGFYLHHVNYRIKDPKVTLDFYTRILGMRLISDLELPSMKTTMYFVGYAEEGEVPAKKEDQLAACLARTLPVIELMHHWGSEDKPDLSYSSGNHDPGRGYSHICVHVPDLVAACKKLEDLGVHFVKKYDDGDASGFAFIKDPDGYWVELLSSELGKIDKPVPAEMQAAMRY